MEGKDRENKGLRRNWGKKERMKRNERRREGETMKKRERELAR